MKCERCGRDLIIPPKAYINLESYNVGGSVLVASNCCNAPYLIKMKVSYDTTAYTGSKNKDDWGVSIKPFTTDLNAQGVE